MSLNDTLQPHRVQYVLEGEDVSIPDLGCMVRLESPSYMLLSYGSYFPACSLFIAQGVIPQIIRSTTVYRSVALELIVHLLRLARMFEHVAAHVAADIEIVHVLEVFLRE